MIITPKIATGLTRKLIDAWSQLHETRAAYDAAQAQLTAIVDQIEAEDREA